jgi:N-acetylmuramoyl-L-alanine amidase
VELKVLKKGAKGEDVKAMQILLMGYGCKMENNGKTYGADGSYGNATVNGIKIFQKKNNLPQTGECDAKTWAKLLGVK